METKICFNCKQSKPLKDFYQYKSGKNKKYGYYYSFCKKCDCSRKRIMLPWVKTYRRIEARCNYDYGAYHKRGIKNYLTTKDLKYLWYRDCAYSFLKPSIDRKNSLGDYTLENCRYIELSDNLKRKKGSKTQ